MDVFRLGLRTISALCARDINGLVYFGGGHESPVGSLRGFSGLVSRFLVSGRRAIRSMRENMDKRGIGIQRVLLNR